jgi:hypothetical protein
MATLFLDTRVLPRRLRENIYWLLLESNIPVLFQRVSLTTSARMLLSHVVLFYTSALGLFHTTRFLSYEICRVSTNTQGGMASFTRSDCSIIRSKVVTHSCSCRMSSLQSPTVGSSSLPGRLVVEWWEEWHLTHAPTKQPSGSLCACRII